MIPFPQVVNTVSYLIPEFLNFIFSIFNPALQRVLCSIQIFFYVAEFLHSEAQMNKAKPVLPMSSLIPGTVPSTK